MAPLLSHHCLILLGSISAAGVKIRVRMVLKASPNTIEEAKVCHQFTTLLPISTLLAMTSTETPIAKGIKPKTFDEVVIMTCKQRLRPILLTTATTVFGLMPLAMGVSVDVIARSVEIGSRVVNLWQNLASSIVFGLAFSTILTLIFTPAALMLPNKIRQWWDKRGAKFNSPVNQISS